MKYFLLTGFIAVQATGFAQKSAEDYVTVDSTYTYTSDTAYADSTYESEAYNKKTFLFYDDSSATQKEYAQSETAHKPIDEKTWEKAKDNNTYSEKQKEQKIKPNKQWINLGWLGPLKGILLYGTMALVLFFLIYIIYRFIAGQKFRGNLSVSEVSELQFDFQDIEDRLPETDLDKYLREAIERKDFRMAIRIYFLKTIQTLNETGNIEWKKNKTNSDYLSELQSKQLYGEMSIATILFERIWYGKQTVSEDSFKNLQAAYVQFISKIGRA